MSAWQFRIFKLKFNPAHENALKMVVILNVVIFDDLLVNLQNWKERWNFKRPLR